MYRTPENIELWDKQKLHFLHGNSIENAIPKAGNPQG